MRRALSGLVGLGVASVGVLLLHSITDLSTLQLCVAGVLACALTADAVYPTRSLRRAALRLHRRMQGPGSYARTAAQQDFVRFLARGRTALRARISRLPVPPALSELFRRGRRGSRRLAAMLRLMRTSRDEGDSISSPRDPDSSRSDPGPRARFNPMWISYAAVAAWAMVEVVNATRQQGIEPLQQAAADASSTVQAVAETSAAVVAIGAATLGADSSPDALGGTLLIDRSHPASSAVALAAAPTDATGKKDAGSRLLCTCRDGRCECPGVIRKLVSEPRGRSM